MGSIFDPDLVIWSHLLDSADREDAGALTRVAEGLYGQLGQAYADLHRLRGKLHQATVRAEELSFARGPSLRSVLKGALPELSRRGEEGRP